MNRKRISLVLLLALCLSLNLNLSHAAFASQQTPPPNDGCTPAWRVVSHPQVGNGQRQLYDVTSLAANDAWAVGTYSANSSHGLALHWDGHTWQQTAEPSPVPNSVELHAVSAAGPQQVWSVGMQRDGSGRPQPFTQRWNGSHWQVVASPTITSFGEAIFLDVAALSADDVWAVGAYNHEVVNSRALIAHWDGISWQLVPQPFTGWGRLDGVAAYASNDVWAVGWGLIGGLYQGLTLHWDGNQWQQIANPSPTNSVLSSIVTIAANDVWAVGSTNADERTQTLVEHWNGTAWQIMPSLNVGLYRNALTSITAVSPTDIWVVGFQTSQANTDQPQPLIWHWDGSQWRYTYTNLTSVYEQMLLGVAPTGDGAAWTVGYSLEPYRSSTNWNTLIARYQPLIFSDVAPGYIFHDDIYGLACLGLLDGYPDGSFRPNEFTTRGQFAKIAVNAFGLSASNPITPTFSDVFSSNPFYRFIEAAAHSGVMTGYSDGSFRPDASITRVEVAAVARRAAGSLYPTYMPTTPTFADVPTSNPLYTDIETLVPQGIISGAPCGNERCFRPNAPISRGELSRIVNRAQIRP